MTFPELAKHCKETRYCEAQFDNEGRKIIGVRNDTIEGEIKALEVYGNPRLAISLLTIEESLDRKSVV